MARANQPYDQHHAVDAKAPAVSASQIIAAGLASAGAAAATSRFGVAGTLVGAALTTMIITGGSAILKAYLENISGRIKSAPEKLRATRNREQAGRGTARPPADDAPTEAVETRSERRGPMAKVRSAFEWFRGLSASAKTSILLKAAIPMAIVFVIVMVAITGAELVGGQTLSCMIWSECYASADGTGSRSSLGSLASGGGGAQPIEQPGISGQPGDGSGGGLFDRFGGGGNAADEQYSQ